LPGTMTSPRPAARSPAPPPHGARNARPGGLAALLLGPRGRRTLVRGGAEGPYHVMVFVPPGGDPGIATSTCGVAPSQSGSPPCEPVQSQSGHATDGRRQCRLRVAGGTHKVSDMARAEQRGPSSSADQGDTARPIVPWPPCPPAAFRSSAHRPSSSPAGLSSSPAS